MSTTVKIEASFVFKKNKIKIIKKKIEKGIPTVPSKISEEIDCNIFLKAIDLESFSKLRDLKDNF